MSAESRAGRHPFGRLRRTIALSLRRQDAHPGDLSDLAVEDRVPDGIRLSALVAAHLATFLARAPRARWICRLGTVEGHLDIAEVDTLAMPEPTRTRLLVDDGRLRDLLAPGTASAWIACRDAPLPRRAARPDA